jgi:hypothetical protein
MFKAIKFHLSTISFHHSTINPNQSGKNQPDQPKSPPRPAPALIHPTPNRRSGSRPAHPVNCTQDSKPQGIRRFTSGEIYEDEIYS